MTHGSLRPPNSPTLDGYQGAIEPTPAGEQADLWGYLAAIHEALRAATRTSRVWKKWVTWARVRGIHQAGHHLVRVVGIGDEMQHRDQQDADRTGQVQGAGGGGQDRARNSRANRATSAIDGMTWMTRSATARVGGEVVLAALEPGSCRFPAQLFQLIMVGLRFPGNLPASL